MKKKTFEQKQVLCIHICRLVLGENFYKYCVTMAKKKRLFLAKYIIEPMLILKTMTACTVKLKHDKRDTLNNKTTFYKHFLNFQNT